TASVSVHVGVSPAPERDAAGDDTGAGGTSVYDRTTGSPAWPSPSRATTVTEYVPSGAPVRCTVTVEPQVTVTATGPVGAEHWYVTPGTASVRTHAGLVPEPLAVGAGVVGAGGTRV